MREERGLELDWMELDIRVSMDAAGAADVDDYSGFIIFDAEIRGGGLDEFEGGCGMNGNDGIPLLIRELFIICK